jgi:D-sorbitol dehydrogenase (acceptor)
MTFNPAPTDLSGKIAFVTGACGGIGAATVAHFAALGATVYATDMADSFDGPATYRRIDLLNATDLDACCAWIAEVKPDILFNNAAIFGMGSVLEAGDLAQYDLLFGVNVRAFYAVMQAAAKSMVANGKRGSIINMGSNSWWEAGGGFPAYATAKSAAHGLTRTMARDLGQYRIRVNTVVPGWIMTERQVAMWLPLLVFLIKKGLKQLISIWVAPFAKS